MTDPLNETELLRAFQADPGAETFGRLADRHLPLIWSTARRVLFDEPALVEDAVQLVLTDLARRGPRLRAEGSLGGWLHQHTFFTASKLRRTEHRRRRRESAAAMTTASNRSDAYEDSWRELAPHLDAALASLPEKDRSALVLRFFEGHEYHFVGQALGLSDDAARKRIERALAILRKKLGRLGVALPATALSAMLAAHARATPPPGWGEQLVTAAWSQRGGAPGIGAAVGGRLSAWLALPWTVPATATVLALCGLVWWQQIGAHPPKAPAPAKTTLFAPAGPPGDPLVVQVTVFNVEESLVATSLRSFNPGHDDAALWQRLDGAAVPAAAFSPETTGPGDPRPVLGPIVRAAALEQPVTSGRRATFEERKGLTFATEFEPPEGPGDVGTPTAWLSWNIGTAIQATLGPRRADGRRQASVEVRHDFEPPAWVHWPTRIWATGSSEGGESMPGPQELALSGTLVLAPDLPRLIASTTVPPPIDAPPAPRRRLLAFVRFTDPSAP